MPGSEYSAVSGGVLKLKGAGIEKKRKKKKVGPQETSTARVGSPKAESEITESPEKEHKTMSGIRDHVDEIDDSIGDSKYGKAVDGAAIEGHKHEHLTDSMKNDIEQTKGKTEAERNYEERRRRRLEERLRREGGKTHKERVEELNRYLSSLSEHHDMPRIGPG
ncbi:DUF1754-domain-containing protein [Patellaria atrata CBS 101060]|uniref:DUF1754-domain-containing protein n=1 Tax=Patellaria atrata CBS 101060 TaxID=1346257 RepID=A0A9P4SB03_9PEZI|nr:DUF1754-domain-containing protein [Patellaria atrata CBS 101060]